MINKTLRALLQMLQTIYQGHFSHQESRRTVRERKLHHNTQATMQIKCLYNLEDKADAYEA